MAASAATASSSPGLSPNYAVICSFLERYGALLDLPEFTFPQLERYLQDTSSVPKLLVDLHVKLLRKIGKSVSADRWEKYLVKLCQEFNTTWAWELEEKGYKSLTTESKTAILKYLCECQFDDNIKFKTAINEEDPDKMRLQPIGRDKDGQMYWFQLDQDDNVRLYLEEQDDLDGSSWKCIVKDRNDLAEVVALLKTQIDPELLKRDELKKAEGENGGEKGEVKKNEDTSDEEKDSNKASCPVSPKTEKDEKDSQNEKLKCEASEAQSSLNGVIESKTEADHCSENKGTKVQSIKEEPMEVTDTKTRTESSETASDTTTHSLVKVEKEVETKKNAAEEIQQALKNEQQNKIPLKKRGMKFSEDFEKSSSNIVPTPPVTQVKDAPKADVTPEQTKRVNDHVNGESLPESEKDLHCRQTLGEQKTEATAVKSNLELKKDSPSTDTERTDQMDTAGSERVTQEVTSHQEKSTTEAVVGENDSASAAEEKEAHESPPPLKAESPPGPKDVVNNAPDKSCQEEVENIKHSLACEVEASNGNAATSTEGDKTSKTAETEEQNLRQEVTSNKAESKDPEEETSSADMETESGKTQEPNTSEKMKYVSDVIKTDVPNNTGKDTLQLDSNEAKPEEPLVKETPEVIKVAEAQSDSRDDSKETHDTEAPAVSKETETVKDSDSKETQEVAACSSVIKRLDKPSETQPSEEKPDITAATETSVIKKVDKLESSAPTENDKNDLKGTPENVDEVTDKTEETEKREDVAENVNCDKASLQQDLKKSDSAPEPMEVEGVSVKDDLKKSEENGDKTEAKAAETKEETSEGNNKSSQEKETNVPEETQEKATESENQKPDDSPKATEMEQVSSEKKTDSEKESGKGSEGEKSLNDKHPCKDRREEEESAGDKAPKPDQSDENKQSENSDKSEKNELQGADAKSSAESEELKSTEVPSNKVADEENKSGKEETREDVNGDEAPVDVPKRGGRRRTKHLVHRRRAELQQEERQGDSESDTNTGMSLRRSPRISRPTVKAVEINERKAEKQHATPEKVEKSKAEQGKEEEEEEEKEEEVKVVQKKPREKKADQEGQPKPKGRKRRKVRWSNTRTRRKKKSSEDEENSDEESSEEEESEEEDTSDEDYKVERTKKRRNRNRERRSSDSSTSSDDDLPPNDDPCKHCGLPNHPELILLCDSCDSGYHTACLRPPLMVIPDGEWFCPPCQHKQLCDKLEEQLVNLDAALKKRERAERRKERLIYVGISLENIITPSVEMEVEEEKPQILIKEKKESKKHKSWGQRSTRTKRPISYRFDEFDEAIEEAIEEDIKEAEGGGAGRGKDMANITGHRGKDMSVILQADEGKENGRPPLSTAAQRKKKRRRLNDLDSDSTVDEEESEEEFRLSESSEEDFVVSNNESEAESEADSNDSDFGSKDSGRQRKSSWKRQPTRRSSRKRRRPRGYSDDEEEETDEDDEEEIVTEGSSEYSDSDLDMSRRRSRRSQKPTVNYCETSESEGSQPSAKRPKLKSSRRPESSDSEVSFKDSEEESREERVKRRADSSDEDSRQRRRRLALKRRRAWEDADSEGWVGCGAVGRLLLRGQTRPQTGEPH
uniref:Remodeling and spacing factor 1b, tandem duplicate 1 n=1 Tax=Cynoglossus semilaevis TaxID=244447 RepID=A0A3P8WBG3_CYNSE